MAFITNRDEVIMGQYDDHTVVVYGDYGGVIYLTFPARLIRCSPCILEQMCREIDFAFFKNQGDYGADFKLLKIGDLIPGGKGGGYASNGLWCHRVLKGEWAGYQPWVDYVTTHFPDGRLVRAVEAVLMGQIESIMSQSV